MKVFLTGATGFIGGTLLKKLISLTEVTSVHCLVRTPEKLNNIKLSKVQAFRGDITDYDSVKMAMTDCDVAFHLAAWYELGIAKSKTPLMEQINIEGTRHVLQAAKELNLKETIYISTVYALGESGEHISTEATAHPGTFTCEYERTKYLAHEVAKQFIKDGLPLKIGLPAAVYGEEDPSVLGETLTKLAQGKLPVTIKGAGEGRLGYVHVDDLTDGILLIWKRGAIGEDYILAGEVMQTDEVMNLVAQVAGKRPPRYKIPVVLARFAATLDEQTSRLCNKRPMLTHEALNSMFKNFAVSSEKAKSELGFSPRSNREGLKQTVKWILNA